MALTNREKWHEFTDPLPSPENYIHWAWRFLVCASLQRRVWLPPTHHPCFPNIYCILVGKPGLGKGLVITKVLDLLKFWKLEDARKILNGDLTQEQRNVILACIETNLKEANESEHGFKNKKIIPPKHLLIPMAPDATTYEALIKSVAESFRRIPYDKYDSNGQKEANPGVYGHSSLAFGLPELASLLRKRTDDTVNYMLGLYDCPDDYEYDTKTQGKDRVRRGCLNLFAGTTPNFMQQVFNEKLIDQGFGSRTFFIYAERDRRVQYFIPELTPEQAGYRTDLLEHIFKLSQLYGECKLEDGVKEYLEEWWKETGSKYQNKSPKLEGYYGRKKVHVMKIAMAEHFSESTEMTIPLARFKDAIDVCDEEESRMQFAIVLEGANPIAPICREIIKQLTFATEGKMFIDLHMNTIHMATKDQLIEAMAFLQETKQITEDTKQDLTGDNIQIWKIKN